MQKIIQALFFTLKKIQIYFTTLKNRIEIAGAYTHPGKINDSFFKNIRLVIIALFAIAGLAGIAFAVYKYHQTARAYLVQQVRYAGSFLKQQRTTRIPDSKPTVITKRAASDTNHANVHTIAEEPLITLPDSSSVRAETLTIDSVHYKPKPDVTIHQLTTETDTTTAFFLVANKAFRTLHLLHFQHNEWQVVREFDIAIGQQQGQKVHAGDKKTPEGQYFILGRKERAELNEIYGPLAYVLNYPNEEDVKAGRTGQGIWIHGTDPDSMPLETRGCLEMKNSDLSSLSKLLRRGIGIPVLIIYNDSLVKPASAPDFVTCAARQKTIIDNYTKTTALFQKFIIDWKTAWETKKFDAYASFYDTAQFKGQGLDWNGWKERKLHTFDLYDTIAITINDIMITDYSETSTIVKFYQLYRTNLNKNDNAKKLHLQKVNDYWKIISESTCSKEELLL